MKWIKCSDQLPEYYEEVIIYTRFGNEEDEQEVTMGWLIKPQSKDDTRIIFKSPIYSFILTDISHWMPLPLFPKDQK